MSEPCHHFDSIPSSKTCVDSGRERENSTDPIMPTTKDALVDDPERLFSQNSMPPVRSGEDESNAVNGDNELRSRPASGQTNLASTVTPVTSARTPESEASLNALVVDDDK